MSEQVIIVYGTDGEILAVVSPSDPLNPQITMDEITQDDSDVTVEIHIVLTMTQYNNALEG